MMTDDKRFEETLNDEDDSEDRKEIQTMCEFLDRIEAKGEQNKAIQVTRSLYERGMGIEEIAEIVAEPVEKVTQWLGLVMA